MDYGWHDAWPSDSKSITRPPNVQLPSAANLEHSFPSLEFMSRHTRSTKPPARNPLSYAAVASAKVQLQAAAVPSHPNQTSPQHTSLKIIGPIVSSALARRGQCNPQPTFFSKKQNKGKVLENDPKSSFNASSNDRSGFAREIPKGLEVLGERLLGLSMKTRSSLMILLQVGHRNRQTITMSEFERVMRELGMEIANGPGAQFKVKPTIFGPNQPNITFHRVANSGYQDMVNKGNDFRRSYPGVVDLMVRLWEASPTFVETTVESTRESLPKPAVPLIDPCAELQHTAEVAPSHFDCSHLDRKSTGLKPHFPTVSSPREGSSPTLIEITMESARESLPRPAMPLIDPCAELQHPLEAVPSHLDRKSTGPKPHFPTALSPREGNRPTFVEITVESARGSSYKSAVPLVDHGARHRLARLSRIPTGLSNPGRTENTTNCARTRYTGSTYLPSSHSNFGFIQTISLARPCWKLGDPSLEPLNHTHPPEDGDSYSGYRTQSGGGQWANPGGSLHREAGVWSHGSFNTDDPPAPLLWEAAPLEDLYLLDCLARLKGYALVPLSWLSGQTGSQPTYQLTVPPTPPVPLPFQPSTVPEPYGELNYADPFATSLTADGRNNSILDGLRYDIPAPSDSSMHPIDTYATLQPNPAPYIAPDLHFGQSLPDLLGDLGAPLGDLNAFEYGIPESNINQLGQLNNYIPSELGAFSNTPDMPNPSFSAQTGSANPNTYAPVAFNRSNASSFHGVLSPSLTTMENPVNPTLLQHNYAHAQHTIAHFSQSNQAHINQAQPGLNTAHVSHPLNAGPFADLPGWPTTNPVLQQNQTHTAGPPTSYQFEILTPETYLSSVGG